jgi:hypothetical protein
MESIEIQKLRTEIAELKNSVAELERALDLDSDSTTHHIKALYQYVADIHDYLMPMVHKVFPGFTQDKKQIDAFMKGRGNPPEGETTAVVKPRLWGYFRARIALRIFLWPRMIVTGFFVKFMKK